MEMLIVLAGVLVILPLILSIIAIAQVASLTRSLDDLKAQRSAATAAVVRSIAPDLQPQEKKPEASIAAQALEIPPEVTKYSIEDSPKLEDGPESIAELASVAVKTSPRNVEQALASRWFVWIGGVAIALGGLLFVKYAFDHRLISPTLQIVTALIVAGGFVGLSDRLRLKSAAQTEADYVPAALSAAGLAIAFGAIFAAYALYALVSPAVAFLGLGLVGLCALALSLRQGPFIAALGIAGSYVTPSLVQTSSPNAWTFFPYLLIIMASSFAVLRLRPWWWLGFASVAGSAAWAILWMHGPFVSQDSWPLGSYTLAFGALSFLAIKGNPDADESKDSWLQPMMMSPALQIGAVGAAATALVLSLLVFKTHHDVTSLVFFGMGMAAISAVAWFKQRQSIAVLAAAAVSFCTLFLWPEVADLRFEFFDWHSTILSDTEARRYLSLMLMSGAAFGAFGLLGIFRKQPSTIWAVLAAVAPIAFIGGAWLQVQSLLTAYVWAILASALASLLLASVYLRRSKLRDLVENRAMGFCSVAIAIALAFACDQVFDGVWLTLSLATLALGFALLTKPLPVLLLGPISAAFGTLTAGRLFLSRELLSEFHELPWGKHWPLYGYGIPIVLFWIASRILKKSNNQRSSTGLEAISLGLAISLVSLELRVLIGGGIAQRGMTLLELSSHILAWMGAAFGLVYRQTIYSSAVSIWGSRLLLAVSCLALVFLSMGWLNPIFSGEAIEGGAIFNSLWLAYLVPVLLLALLLRAAPAAGLDRWRSALGVLALVLLLSFVTLEVKRIFQGPHVFAEFSSDAESYAMSAVWLVLAVFLFVIGLNWNRKNIRYGGLAVVILALFKTFGYDLWQLGGLWQIASVMGIGLSLVGMGWLYTRFIRSIEQNPT